MRYRRTIDEGWKSFIHQKSLTFVRQTMRLLQRTSVLEYKLSQTSHSLLVYIADGHFERG